MRPNIHKKMQQFENNIRFSLDMEALFLQMKRLQLEDKVVTLLNQLWDSVCTADIIRRGVEFTSEFDGMEFTVGELKVPAFYFLQREKILELTEKRFEAEDSTEYQMRAVMQQTCETLVYGTIYPMVHQETVATPNRSQKRHIYISMLKKLSLIHLQDTFKILFKKIYL